VETEATLVEAATLKRPVTHQLKAVTAVTAVTAVPVELAVLVATTTLVSH
jgi:hypothetical protein